MAKEETSVSPAGKVLQRVEAIRDGNPYERISEVEAATFDETTMRRLSESYVELGRQIAEEPPGEALARAYNALAGESDDLRQECLERAIEEAAADGGLDLSSKAIRRDLARRLHENWTGIEHVSATVARTSLLEPVMERLLAEGPTEAKAAFELVAEHRVWLRQEAQDWTAQIVSKLPDQEVGQLPESNEDRHKILEVLVASGRTELAMQLARSNHERASLFSRLNEARDYRNAIRLLEDMDDSAGHEQYNIPHMYQRVADCAIGDLVNAGRTVTVRYSRVEGFFISAGVHNVAETKYSSRARRALTKNPRRYKALAVAAVNEHQERLKL